MAQIDKFYKRLRNEAIDNERKIEREAFELLAKHIELMDKQPERTIKTMTDQQEAKIKQLVSEFGITINTIFQNYGKATFTGIGGLQTRYENLASAMRDILAGPYDTEDKDFAIKLTASLVVKVKKLISLMQVNADAFQSAEKRIVDVILANMEPKAGNGFEPAYQPLGTFTDILVINKSKAKSKAGRPTLEPIARDSEEYRNALTELDQLVNHPDELIATNARQARTTLTKGSRSTPVVGALVFEGVVNTIRQLKRRLEPPTPTVRRRTLLGEEEGEFFPGEAGEA